MLPSPRGPPAQALRPIILQGLVVKAPPAELMILAGLMLKAPAEILTGLTPKAAPVEILTGLAPKAPPVEILTGPAPKAPPVQILTGRVAPHRRVAKAPPEEVVPLPRFL